MTEPGQPPAVRQFDRFEATFQPTRTDDLRPGVASLIGKRFIFKASFLLDHGPYASQWAMVVPRVGWEATEAAWVPWEDLEDPVLVEGPKA